MRSNFVNQVIIEMQKNPRIFFLTADLGFNALEPLRDKFGPRFINAGIAEANMIGVAAGLALTGKKVIAYSIAPFITMRCYEQIRLDIAYHNLDVKLIGIGGGFNYGDQGVTHHTIEDVAIMRVLPNMKIICPAYAWETQEATSAILKDNGPAYLRIGISPGADYHQSNWRFKIGRGFVIQKGKDIALFCTGNVLDLTLNTAALLKQKLKTNIAVISLPTVKPLDKDLILKIARETKHIFTIEENNVIGGLGSAVADLLIGQKNLQTNFRSFGIPDVYIKDVGTREYLCSKAGLDAQQISRKI